MQANQNKRLLSKLATKAGGDKSQDINAETPAPAPVDGLND